MMKKILFIILIFLLSCSNFSILHRSNFLEHYQQGIKAIENKKYQLAIDQLKTAIKYRKRPILNYSRTPARWIDYCPYYFLGVAYKAIGDFPEAVKNFKISKDYGAIKKSEDLSKKFEEEEKWIERLIYGIEDRSILTPDSTEEKPKGDPIEKIKEIWKDALIELLNLPPYNKSYAVVIGINQYKDNKMKDNLLNFAVNDARCMEKYFREEAHFDEIISLYDSAATAQNIKKTIIGLKDKLPKQKITDSRIVIYFSGHGGSAGGTGYLIPYEGTLSEPHVDGIPINWITDEVKEVIPAKHILFIFDNCYSGLGFKSKGELQKWAYNLTKKPSVVLLSAGTSDQQVIEDKKLNQSLYTHFLLEGLKGNADLDGNKVITLNELHTYVHGRVSQKASEDYKREQTPQIYHIAGEGEIIFYRVFSKEKE